MTKIVIFEDDLEIGSVLSLILNQKGYLVKVFTKVDEACCKVVLNENPDVIIMDLSLPIIGGEKAIELLKANCETKNIPVMIFSAQVDAALIAKKLKTEGFLAKPFDIRKLLNQIESLRISYDNIRNSGSQECNLKICNPEKTNFLS
jgi:DNA-binding response OmpR family regulator